MKYLAKLLCLFAVFASIPTTVSAGTLETIKGRGVLNCGVSQGLAGFSIAEDKGNWTGFDVDFCRAIAAAIFNDPTKIKFFPLSADERFSALRSGSIDVLSRNSTWTLSRENPMGLKIGRAHV